MNARAAELIASLGLVPHPEGGYFRELHRSASSVQPLDGRTERAALTTIYFLLPEGEVSRWHRVASDEVWHHYEGAPLDILTADATFERVTRHTIGPVRENLSPERVVPSGCWQAARSSGAYTLVGCVVGPGFEFADFALLRDGAPHDVAAARGQADAAAFI